MNLVLSVECSCRLSSNGDFWHLPHLAEQLSSDFSALTFCCFLLIWNKEKVSISWQPAAEWRRPYRHYFHTKQYFPESLDASEQLMNIWHTYNVPNAHFNERMWAQLGGAWHFRLSNCCVRLLVTNQRHVLLSLQQSPVLVLPHASLSVPVGLP